MFTGIVETTAAIKVSSDHGSSRRLTIACPWDDARLGQSVAVNGCCLTIADLAGGAMSFDVVAETIHRTNLGLLNVGDEVNLERSLRLSDRLDGHLVQGHIDGVAMLLSREDSAKECRLTIQSPTDLAKYIVPKGSLTLDGVSLTVAGVSSSAFEVALIPTTLKITTLRHRAVGWPMNLETDILSKTIVFWLERQANVGHSE
jgi:riboflavin synthase